MRDHWRRLSLRDMSRFVAVVAIVAVVVVMIGREASISRQTGASVDGMPNAETPRTPQQQASEMTVALSAPDICETGYGSQGWRVGETTITWQVIGGTPPYSLVIDGETQDAHHAYVGQTGTASVSCALNTGNVTYQTEPREPLRGLSGHYVVDSGLKAIQATATDAAGNSATSVLKVYVILDTGRPEHLLRAGRTYRIFGTLVTIPLGVDMRISDRETGDSGYDYQRLGIEGSNAGIWFNLDGYEEVAREIPQTDTALATDPPNIDLNVLMDALVDSIGQLPKIDTPE